MNYDFEKIELHCHLDGSFRLKTMHELAKEKDVKLPGETLEGFEKWMIKHANAKDVNEYLEMFDAPTQVLQDKASLTRITKELIDDMATEGIVYAEIRFAPQIHTHKGLTQDEATEAVLEGKRLGEEANPSIKIGIITCMMSFGPQSINWKENEETIEVCNKFKNKGVVGLDLAGAEGFVPLSVYKPLFDKAHEYGLNTTCHAGDSVDADTVYDAVFNLKAMRIGHGHHVIKNLETCKYLAQNDIALEICPTSNIQCKTQPSFELHPAKELFDLGVPVTISCDNKVMTRALLKNEYDHCINEMGFTYQDLIKMNINAMRCSFADQDYKDEIIKILENKL